MTSDSSTQSPDVQATRARIKDVIVREAFVEGLTADEIEDTRIIFGEGLGLDSIDALQLVLGLEREFGVKIDTNTLDRERLATVAGMADFVHELKRGDGGAKKPGHR